MAKTFFNKERKYLVDAGLIAFRAVGFLWLLHVLRLFLGMHPGSWGILPRRIDGLMGIVTAPLAHSGWEHLANNSVPLLATIFLLAYFYPRIALRAMIVLYVLTGIVVWLLARGEGWGATVTISHVGASGVAYALVSFLFFLGLFRRSMQSIVVALIILFYFSGMIAGVLPDQLNVSWESHLLGGVVGAVVAFAFRSAVVRDEAVENKTPYQKTPVLPADTFAYTLAEREAIRRARIEAYMRQNRALGDEDSAH